MNRDLWCFDNNARTQEEKCRRCVFVPLMLGSREIETILIPAKIRPPICADLKWLRQAILLAHPLDCYSGSHELSLCNLVKYLIEMHQTTGIVSQKKSINGRVPLASFTHQRKHNMGRWHALATMRRQHAPATNVEQCCKNYPEKLSMHHYRRCQADIKMEVTWDTTLPIDWQSVVKMIGVFTP